ncbi:hypothetical protein GTP55_15760 [Duganella sp. FT109W]|uniref:Uncharacterized protein n=1 Tax=Duganella margarita TaxID=2692170 RepID=A0ABW9WI52_9BURK|nr:hypothetical protein [Duganella margarita]MYN40822.1 hypothetical protein [Duganella margarita]
MDRWQQYLFEEHPETELRAWARRLKLFRFFRAFGGHANDGDSLDVAYAYQTREQLTSFMALLGITLFKFERKPPQAEPGVSYRGEVFAKFPSLIAGTEWLEQPAHCEIMGIAAFVWCSADSIKISVGDRYTVSEKNVQNAEKIETLLTGVTLERIDPPLDTKNYICPRHYPDYFS